MTGADERAPADPPRLVWTQYGASCVALARKGLGFQVSPGPGGFVVAVWRDDARGRFGSLSALPGAFATREAARAAAERHAAGLTP